MIAPPALTVRLPAAIVSTLLLLRLKFSSAGLPELPKVMMPPTESVLTLVSAGLKVTVPWPVVLPPPLTVRLPLTDGIAAVDLQDAVARRAVADSDRRIVQRAAGAEGQRSLADAGGGVIRVGAGERQAAAADLGQPSRTAQGAGVGGACAVVADLQRDRRAARVRQGQAGIPAEAAEGERADARRERQAVGRAAGVGAVLQGTGIGQQQGGGTADLGLPREGVRAAQGRPCPNCCSPGRRCR